MAESIVWRCTACDHTVEAWSDGNPYIIEDGKKRYVYHPDHEALARAVGNDVPMLCLACGHAFMSDTARPAAACPRCTSNSIRSTFDLGGCDCPVCHAGTFGERPEMGAIS